MGGKRESLFLLRGLRQRPHVDSEPSQPTGACRLLALLAARVYLSLFADRAAITPAPFLLALAITTAVACATVFSRVVRAAGVEPAAVLRYE